MNGKAFTYMFGFMGDIDGCNGCKIVEFHMFFFEPGAPVVGKSDGNEGFGLSVFFGHGVHEVLSESVAFGFS